MNTEQKATDDPERAWGAAESAPVGACVERWRPSAWRRSSPAWVAPRSTRQPTVIHRHGRRHRSGSPSRVMPGGLGPGRPTGGRSAMPDPVRMPRAGTSARRVCRDRRQRSTPPWSPNGTVRPRRRPSAQLEFDDYTLTYPMPLRPATLNEVGRSGKREEPITPQLTRRPERSGNHRLRGLTPSNERYFRWQISICRRISAEPEALGRFGCHPGTAIVVSSSVAPPSSRFLFHPA